MKSLKFTPELCTQILNGTKTTTWRLFDDKNLQEGDEVAFVNRETFKIIGRARITTLKTNTLGNLTDSDWEGHERYASNEEMYAFYQKFYGPDVGPNTELKILNFTFTPTESNT
jgi:hypothetical protein